MDDNAKMVMDDLLNFLRVTERVSMTGKTLDGLVNALDNLPEGHPLAKEATEIAEKAEELAEILPALTAKWWFSINGHKEEDEEK